MGSIDSQHRFLVHFDDGGSGMRTRDDPNPSCNLGVTRPFTERLDLLSGSYQARR
jgi:hypothetical protein